MKIKRYMGNNAQEAILKVKMDLGNEALILNTRKVRQKGIFKFFAKPMIEVLAAVDEYPSVRKDKEQQTGTENKNLDNSTKNAADFGTKDEKLAALENKVNNVELMLRKMLDQVLPPASTDAVKPQASEKQVKSNVLHMFYTNLIKNEVDAEIANKIIDMACKKIGSNASFNDAASALYVIISEILGKPETIKFKENSKPTVVILVGPTGVGKTTTLAKIAANYLLNHKKNVGLITADTYRIAAVEQLKTYAEILGIPLSIVYSSDDLKEAIKSHSDKDIILIDTAGHSNKNKTQFDELKKLIAASDADEVYLVLSITSSMRNNNEVLSNYSFLKDYKLIFTKMDETPAAGILLNTRFNSNRSLSYITNGQNVPDDIELADIDKIAKNLLRSIS
jgi:flagellar biosynthesis protein FlhF